MRKKEAEAMKLKLDESGKVVLSEDGHPVYVNTEGVDIPFDAVKAMGKISSLNEECKTHREAKEAAEAKLVGFEGIENVEAAIKALETVKNIDAKTLVDAGEMETLKRSMAEGYEKNEKKLKDLYDSQILEKDKAILTKDATIFDLMVTSQFAKSPFFSGESPSTLLPFDIAADTFGKNFKVETNGDGELKVIGYLDGSKILSSDPTIMGDPAPFEEAMSVIIDKYPMKQRIMRDIPGSGPDAKGNTGVSTDGKTILRSDKDAFSQNIDKIASGEIRVIEG